MNKSNNFSGQPIIKQVLNFIDPKDVYRTAKRHNIDRYTKKFTTYEHLVTMINAMKDVPCLIKFSSAATHDHTFLKELDLKKGSYVVFDKGYVDYGQYQQWTLDDIYFVTGQKHNARFTGIEEFDIPDNVDNAVLKEEASLLMGVRLALENTVEAVSPCKCL